MTKTHKLLPLAGLMAALALSNPAYSASNSDKTPSYEPERNAQGHPNLQGVTWDFRTITPFERPLELGDKAVFTEEESEAFRKNKLATTNVDLNRDKIPAKFDVEAAHNDFWMDFGTVVDEEGRTSLIVDPPNGRLPELTDKAKAQMKLSGLRIPPVREYYSLGFDVSKFRPAGPEVLGLSERCLLSLNSGPPLLPSAYNNNLRIVQTPNHVVLYTEMIHDARIVSIDGSPHLPSELRNWTGDSRGHWEGDTLVVETTNFIDRIPTLQLPINLIDFSKNAAVGAGASKHLLEKFTRVSESRLLYEYTVTDLTTFTQPYSVAYLLRATDDQMFEYACHEGNHALANMLKGARQAEKEEAAASANP